MNKKLDLNNLVGRFVKLLGNWRIRDINFENEISKKDLIVYIKCCIKEKPIDNLDYSNEYEQSYVIIDNDCREMITHIRDDDDDEIEILS